MKGKPTPIDVYDIVNKVIAQYLDSEPVILPSFRQVVGNVPVPANAPLGVGDACRKPKKRKIQP